MTKDFSDMLSALAAEGVEFLVVGAYALAVHGCPRATGDLDLWVRPGPTSAPRVLAALRRFGAPIGDLALADLESSDTVFQIGVAPQRIDIVTGIDGVDFDEAWASRVPVPLAGPECFALSRELLMRNKRATGRPKDLADLAWLEALDADDQRGRP